MSEVLSIKKSNVIQAFSKGDDKEKALLNNLFGAEIVSQKITDRVKTFEDALNVLGRKVGLPFNHPLTNSDEDACNLLFQMRNINRALCEDWKANYADGNQKKWYCIFRWDASSSSFCFDCSHYGYSGADAGSGVRLCFPTKEIADYFGTQFEKLNSDYLLTK